MKQKEPNILYSLLYVTTTVKIKGHMNVFPHYTPEGRVSNVQQKTRNIKSYLFQALQTLICVHHSELD